MNITLIHRLFKVVIKCHSQSPLSISEADERYAFFILIFIVAVAHSSLTHSLTSACEADYGATFSQHNITVN